MWTCRLAGSAIPTSQDREVLRRPSVEGAAWHRPHPQSAGSPIGGGDRFNTRSGRHQPKIALVERIGGKPFRRRDRGASLRRLASSADSDPNLPVSDYGIIAGQHHLVYPASPHKHVARSTNQDFALSAARIDGKIWLEISLTAPGECVRKSVLVLSLSPMLLSVSKY